MRGNSIRIVVHKMCSVVLISLLEGCRLCIFPFVEGRVRQDIDLLRLASHSIRGHPDREDEDEDARDPMIRNAKEFDAVPEPRPTLQALWRGGIVYPSDDLIGRVIFGAKRLSSLWV